MEERSVPAHRSAGRTRRGILLAMTGDMLVLGLFLYVALGSSSSAGESVAGPLPDEQLEIVDSLAPVVPDVEETPGTGTLKVEIEEALETSEVQVGVAVIDASGENVLSIEPEERFVLASVGKIYIMLAYLAQIEADGERVSDSDLALLGPMIRASDNSSASSLWKRIGGTEGLAEFLTSRGLAVVAPVEKEAWGTLDVTAGEVAQLLWLLSQGRLLDSESTSIALSLLSDINYDQAWGVSAGADAPLTTLYLKNGWYPEREGWRVNSAGIVQSPGSQYVVVILVYPAETMNEGVSLVENIATRINHFIAD